MKILITPFLTKSRYDSSLLFTRSLCRTLAKQGHTCAISTHLRGVFHDVSVVPSEKPAVPFTLFPEDYRTYEEWLYYHGGFSQKFIEKDIVSVQNAIQEFSPDLIITMDRPAAVIEAMQEDIPVWAVVNSAMYRNGIVPAKIIQSFNTILHRYLIEQVFDLKTFYQNCDRRIVFGSMTTEPYLYNQKTEYVNLLDAPLNIMPAQKHLVVSFSELPLRPAKFNKIITEAFLGSPYQVYVTYPDCTASKTGNIHFQQTVRDDLYASAAACIHDGGTYLYNRCILNRVPQMIVTGHEYIRCFNGQAAQRNHLGLYIYEEDFSIASLYEAFRHIILDPDYSSGIEKIRNELLETPDITAFI